MSANGEQGGIRISGVTGSGISFGDHSPVNNRYTAQGEQGREHQELLEAVTEFRADLGRLVANEQTAALDEELGLTADEIERDGRATPGRLARLAELLDGAGAITGLLASGAAVATAVHGALGL